MKRCQYMNMDNKQILQANSQHFCDITIIAFSFEMTDLTKEDNIAIIQG